MKSKNCSQCRKEREQLLHELEYSFFRTTLDAAVCGTTAAVISIMESRGRSAEYIQKLFEDIKLVFDMPKTLQKQLDMVELMHHQTEKYGLDYSTLRTHCESKKEFILGIKKNEKEY